MWVGPDRTSAVHCHNIVFYDTNTYTTETTVYLLLGLWIFVMHRVREKPWYGSYSGKASWKGGKVFSPSYSLPPAKPPNITYCKWNIMLFLLFSLDDKRAVDKRFWIHGLFKLWIFCSPPKSRSGWVISVYSVHTTFTLIPTYLKFLNSENNVPVHPINKCCCFLS